MTDLTISSSAERDTAGRFLAGHSVHRPVGSRNKLTTRFLDDLRATWEMHGKAALEACAVEQPTQFCRLVADLLPRHATLDIDVAVDVADFADRFRRAVALLDGADPDAAMRGYRPPKLINGR
jgi:hypothetical protein